MSFLLAAIAAWWVPVNHPAEIISDIGLEVSDIWSCLWVFIAMCFGSVVLLVLLAALVAVLSSGGCRPFA